MSSQASRISVWVGERRQDLSMDAVRERFLALAREVMGLDAAADAAAKCLLAKQVEWGSFILQIRPHLVADAVFLKWIKEDAKFGHFQKVYAAIGLAQKYATPHGQLDAERLDAAIDAYNAAAKQRGYMPLKSGARSIRAAEVAGGMRPGRRLPDWGKKSPCSGAPEVRITSFDDEFAAISGIGMGGAQSARSVTAAGIAAAEPRAVSPLTPGRPAGSIRDDRPGAGEAGLDLPPPLSSHGGSGGGDRAQAGRVRRGGDAPGQMTLAEEYAAAATIARRVAEAFDRGSVDPQLMRRFVELAELALKGGA